VGLPEPARKSQVRVVAAVLERVAETVQVLVANGLRILARDSMSPTLPRCRLA
jgi:hypothetical protein